MAARDAQGEVLELASGRRRSDRALILDAISQAERAVGWASVGGGADDGVEIPEGLFPGYRVLSEVHRGGQGAVYRAVQTSTGRDVAIKLMHGGGAFGASGRARFDREVQVLGRLDHPGVVSVHDSGQTADGGLYYVMDYVAGRPLDVVIRGWGAEADRSRRSSSSRSSALGHGALRERLELFARVCDGVNAAHLQGVIHRDLKPANIRLNARGEPVVVDFGLAKLLQEDGAGAMTATGQFLGSMPWASPEQAEGAQGSVDTRSDVYSLGVILFQIITGGRFPYVVTGTMREVLHNIAHAEPQRPTLIDRGINDEVETIAFKALSKARERRYQTAGELGRDVRRYLAGEPIEAKRDSGWYLLRKSLRRHRVPAGFIAAIAVLTLGFTAALAGMYGEAVELRARAEERAEAAEEARLGAERERARAEENFDAVRGLARVLMFDFHDEIEHLRGATRARETVVTKATEYLALLQAQVDGEIAPREGLLRDLAAAYDRLAGIQAGHGEANRGETEAAERSLARAAEIRAGLLARRPGDGGLWLDEARALVARGRIEQRQGAYEEGIASGHEALAALARARDLGVDEGEVGRARAETEVLLGDLHTRFGQSFDRDGDPRTLFESARRHFGAAAAWWTTGPGQHAPDRSQMLARVLAQRSDGRIEEGVWYLIAAKAAEEKAELAGAARAAAEMAIADAVESAALFGQAREENPASREAQHGLVHSKMGEGQAIDTLADALALLGDEHGIDELRERELLAYQAAYDASLTLARDEADLEAQRLLGLAMNKLGNGLRAHHRLDEAEILYEELIAHRRALYRVDDTVQHLRDLAIVIGKRAQIQFIRADREPDPAAKRKHLLASAAGFREALAMFREMVEQGAPEDRGIGMTERIIQTIERRLRELDGEVAGDG